MINNPKELTKFRDVLLLSQTGSLLHNLGKATRRFFEWQINRDMGSAPRFKYQHILHLIGTDYFDFTNDLPNLCIDLQETENQNILDSKTVNALTKRSFSLPGPFDDRSYRPGDMIEYLGQGKLEDDKSLYGSSGRYIIRIFPNGSRLTHLMNRAHRGASGGEKQDIYAVGQTDSNHLYRATPFGWESRAPTLIGIDDHKQEIEKIIQNHLGSASTPLDFDNFANKLLRPHLEAIIADTQHPLNDVTVWDIGHSGMAFLLTQAIGLMAQGRSIDHDELANMETENTLFWRVLSIRLDGLRYLEGASSLADLRVRYRLLQESMDRVRSALEGMPVAIEVYRDENGSFYIFPDLPDEHSLTRSVWKVLQSKLAVDGVALTWSLSGQLVNHPKDAGKYIGEYICKQINNESELPDSHDLVAYTTPWWTATKKEICVVCGIRPQGYGADQIQNYLRNPKHYSDKAELRKLCCFCMDRRRGVAERWVNRGLQDSTVWIDEVADEAGRVALVVGQFNLQNWGMWYPKKIDGAALTVETHLKIQNVGDTLENGDGVAIRRQGSHYFEWDMEKKVLVGRTKVDSIPKFKQEKFPSLNKAVDTIECEGTDYRIVLCEPHGKTINQEHTIIGFQFLAENEHALVTVGQRAARKIEDLFLWGNDSKWFAVTGCLNVYECPDFDELAESQSFARIRRVWETTRYFWQDILPTDQEAEISESVCGRELDRDTPGPHRLEISGGMIPKKPNDTPGPYHAYTLSLGNTKLSVVWDPKNQRFTTAHNLKYLAESTRLGIDVEGWLKTRDGQKIEIEEPTGYGSQNKIWGMIRIDADAVKPIPDSTYTPAIPILAEPRTFMALVPADKALDVVAAINEKYEREMGKVRNRLPLHMGVVFAPYKTPLRAVMDAGRRMLKQKASAEGAVSWEVTEKECFDADAGSLPEALRNDPHFAAYVRLELELIRGGRSAVWHVPLRMGDGSTPDCWYPYVFVKHDRDGNPPDGRKRMFEAPCPWNENKPTRLVHAEDLRCRYVDENGNKKAGDTIYFTPATVDFQWLDTSGRRFEIAYDNNGGRLKIPRRPYLPNEFETLQKIWGTLSDHLTSTQIHAFREMIGTKREEWGISEESRGESETFRQFCRDAITNIEWKKCNGKYPWKRDAGISKHDWLDAWADYAVRGWLDDTIELYMQIMKEKPKYEKERSP
ncbi:MAG: hypothetical protein C4B59_10685 [Candidatus Methanogaster sp.]|uniref:Uncharacterized protein n=1 Tax=Candidatus Methanogaster sp. TaxID=3386292 RepID=A0AC61L194_9EURY|nr:MAG: hypothetical protein C4B59_10685 [ANME-2 cluster archaeon]